MSFVEAAGADQVIRSEFRANNHYVPGFYLKRWAGGDGRLWTYRLLVPHENVPIWKARTTKGLAYHKHLYTRVIAAGETDEIEKWFDKEFEGPAETAIHKAVTDARMYPEDWNRLARFVAAQDARTPARLMEMLRRWDGNLPTLIQSTLEKSIQKIADAKRNGTVLVSENNVEAEYFPVRVTTEMQPNAETGLVKVETVAGRGLYIFALRRLLTVTLQALEQHRWTILRPPVGMAWATSDDPVIKLNNYDGKNYDFKGGWGSIGTQILLPLGPDHLLYTKIGEKPPKRGSRVSATVGNQMRRMIVEHAHRFVFATDQDPNLPIVRPRIVNADLFKSDVDQWARWHDEQVTAERALFK